MSSWGLTDNVAIAGTVSIYEDNTTVNGASTLFTANLDAGDYLTIGGQKYQVATVTSDTAANLTSVASANVAGATAYLQTGPKYVSNVNAALTGTRQSNLVTIQNIYGIDEQEAGVPENRARNLKSPGWATYNTYTDALGQTRHKAEVLVALSKNFDAAGAGDASDDTVAADSLIYFTTQPANASADTGNAATFFVVATSDPTGATIGYQWYEDNTTHTYAIADGANYSGNTTNTLTINDVTGLDGYEYYVIISGDGGADSNTSDTATLTETTP